MSIKSPEAFRTISEVADELDVPQHVLRFWESKFTAVKPLKRGGGRRYYRPGDVDVLRGVKTLLYTEGYTIRGVQKVFRNEGVKYVAEVGQAGGMRALVAEAKTLAAPDEAEEVIAANAPERPPAQLSLVEPKALKLATVERRRMQQHLDRMSKLRNDLAAALASREHRLAPLAVPMAAKA